MASVFESPITEAIDRAIESDARDIRGHLGMSSIAGDARTLWLQFRWSLPDDITPRTRRIFELGNLLEIEVIRLLKLAGFEVYHDDGTGDQFSFSYYGDHFRGSMDGVVRGLPQAPKTWHVLEVKSVKGGRFVELQKKGVEKWDAAYYGQMQCYMAAAELDRALFAAYNKDTSELYFERVKLDKTYFPAMRVKALDILENDSPPQSSYKDRSWYEIKNYKSEHYQRVYWGDELPPSVNCRNCRFSRIDLESPGAQWICGKTRLRLTLEQQQAGCAEHNFLPALMPAKLTAESAESATYMADNGQQFTNGPEKFSSAELVQLSKVRFDSEHMEGELITQAKTLFPGARISEIEVSPTNQWWPAEAS